MVAASEITVLVPDAVPYVTAAVGAHGGAVLAEVRVLLAEAPGSTVLTAPALTVTPARPAPT